jgi:predicted nuclease of restriction endonuclease-like (RecB) superfamily
MSNKALSFDSLVTVIEQTHLQLQQHAVKAVNTTLTIRNWLIGFYIVEFEQNGEGRAAYGEKLFKVLSDKIAIKGLGETNLKLSRQFYTSYPGLQFVINAKYNIQIPISIRQMPSDEFENTDNKSLVISQSPPDELLKIQDKDLHKTEKYYATLIEKTSFSHFVELMKIEEETKRTFYELLILKSTPSIQELKRHINTLAFERIGLGANTELAMEKIMQKIEPVRPVDAIKTVFLFDFLGIKNDGLLEEKDLETALISHLQDFIRELGLGFCFEYRQKRILIDDEYFFADLVFYHRILKCHVIVELKVDAFKHEYLSQLNTYVAYYNAEVKQADDNPAIGILLCTEKGKKLVEYATAGMDNQLFVSKYLVQLPKKEELEAFILKEIETWK